MPVPRLSPWLISVLALAAAPGCVRSQQAVKAPPAPGESELRLVDVEPTNEPMAVFELEGEPFCFAGTNNYYLNFKSPEMVEDVFVQARTMGLRVIRFWGFIDRGSLDGSVPSVDGDGTKDGVYLQYWDARAGRPAYNDGKDGFERIDFVLHKAREHGIKLTYVLTNNWREFGGMDQYLTWYGLAAHHQFYTDARVKEAYKAWVHHVVTRVNAIDGVPYREDPAIFAWELANEPRCRNFRDFDVMEGWDTGTITAWADEMSAYIKSLDPNHMVAVGDEGFLAGGGSGFPYQAADGVDHRALTALPNVDFGTFHLYPDNWNLGIDFGNHWVEAHLAVARELGKPTVLEEYGTVVRRDRHNAISWGWERRRTAYTNWNEILLQRGGSGAMFWILVGYDGQHGLYPDYDHYSVYNGGPTAALLERYARRFAEEARACELAPPSVAPPSKFVRVRPLPKREAPRAAVSRFSPWTG
ncbi:MAG TPA: cellulase family glycosylhydrolase [Polyangiaceae bacterium]|nr:cellulase family glycosylhydrolase [Polyangiaceae bacterium]